MTTDLGVLLPRLRCRGCGTTFVPRTDVLRGCPRCEGQQLVIASVKPVRLWPRWERHEGVRASA